MININARTCDDAWQQAAKLVQQQGLAQESRTFRSADVTTETLELLHAGMTIEDPRQRIVFSRPINPAFAIAEVIWILAGSNDLDFIAFWNPLMKRFSSDGKTLHGAYGYRLSNNAEGEFDLPSDHPTNYFVPAKLPFSQLKEAYNALLHTPHSRQVVLQIYQAGVDFPVIDGSPRNPDIPCNLIADLKVRDGKLYWQQVMRSNDLFWGTPYNFIQWTTIQEIVAGWLGLEVGQYTHIASSLHVYQEHWNELRELQFAEHQQRNEANLAIKGYDNWLSVFKVVLNAAVKFTKSDCDVIDTATQAKVDVKAAGVAWPSIIAYNQWIDLLAAEVHRKRGEFALAKRCAELAGPYYESSWLQWFDRKENNNG